MDTKLALALMGIIALFAFLGGILVFGGPSDTGPEVRPPPLPEETELLEVNTGDVPVNKSEPAGTGGDTDRGDNLLGIFSEPDNIEPPPVPF